MRCFIVITTALFLAAVRSVLYDSTELISGLPDGTLCQRDDSASEDSCASWPSVVPNPEKLNPGDPHHMPPVDPNPKDWPLVEPAPEIPKPHLMPDEFDPQHPYINLDDGDSKKCRGRKTTVCCWGPANLPEVLRCALCTHHLNLVFLTRTYFLDIIEISFNISENQLVGPFWLILCADAANLIYSGICDDPLRYYCCNSLEVSWRNLSQLCSMLFKPGIVD